MGQLTNLFVSESYQGLLKLANSTTGVTGTLQYVQDGLGNNIPMLVSTSSVVISGSFSGDGSGLTGITATVDSGSLVTTSSFNAYTSSNDARVDALEVETGSLQNQINQKLDTGSFNSYTSSNDAKVNALINATGSYATTSSLTSLSQSIAATDLAQDGRLNSLESTTSSLQNQINQKVDTGSFNAYTSSNDAKVDSLISKTGSYATTGSNNFIGQQNINGSVNVTGSLNVTGEITALSASITYLKTIYQTSSVIFTSGSNILGDEPTDTQTLWGTVILPTGPLSVTGSATISNSLNVQTSLTASGLNYPSADNGVKSFIQTDGNGNLSLQYVDAVNEAIRNGELTTITKGTPLYVSGALGANPIVYRADASDPTKMPVTYIAGDNIASNTIGRGIILGLIEGVNTTGYPVGTEIYVAAGGGWTSTRPTGSAIVQVLGVVTNEGVGGKGLVLNPGPANLPNIQTGNVWVGNANSVPSQVATSSLSVASAVSSSQAQNAVSSSHSVNSDTSISSSFSQNAVSSSHSLYSENSGLLAGTGSGVFATTSSLDTLSGSIATTDFNQDARLNSIESLTSSFITESETGSFATTGSNVFKGNQIITGSVDIRSGSLDLYSNNTTINIDAYLTNSVGGQSNIILGWSDNPSAAGPGATQANYTGSYMINGSNNIVTLPSLRAVAQNGTADQQGYISGSANMIMGNTSGIFLNTSSLLVPKTQGNIISNGSGIYMNYTTSSLAAGQPTISNNFMNGGAAILNHPSGSGNFNANILTNGNITSTQTFTSNNRVTIVANTINNSVILNNISSSISYQNNFNNSPITINNHLSSSGLVAGNLLAFNNNAVFGGSSNTGLSVWVSGSQASQVNRNIIDNLIGGKNIIISSSFVSSSASNLQASLVYGQNLTVAASHITPGGSAFLGRFNDATTLHLAQDIVFAVGTGTGTATRRTGLYVTSGSLVGISGSLDVKGGATTITGSVQGNVLPLTVASNTASLNLNNGNFFELALTGSQDIRIEPSNIKPGQTINIKLNTTGSGTVSFPSSIKQISGSAYVPTTEVATDIITLVSFDTTSLFLANVKNLI